MEQVAGQLSNKRTVRLQTKANDFLRKRFQRSSSGSSGSGGSGSGSSPGGISLSSIRASSGGGKGRPGTLGGAGGMGTTSSSVISLLEAKEQAEILRMELERVQAGVTLLSQSLDKLTEIVRMDTRCCGGIFDIISSSLGPATSVAGSSSGSGVGYDRVQAYAPDIDDSGHAFIPGPKATLSLSSSRVDQSPLLSTAQIHDSLPSAAAGSSPISLQSSSSIRGTSGVVGGGVSGKFSIINDDDD